MRQIPYEMASFMVQSLNFKKVSMAGKVLGCFMWHLLPERKKIAARHSQIVVRQSKDTYIRRIMDHYRGSEKVEIVHQDQAAREVLRCLQQNGITAFLVDHNCGRNQAVFVPFFNKRAAVNMGPAVLTVRAKALLWPIFLLRNGSGAYALQAYQPLDTVALQGSPKDKITFAAKFYTQVVEKMIRRYPEQCYWMHRRWKTRPQEEESAVRKRIGQAPSA
jgi:KDO2-lipid IV(A) lauroyltransferase